MTKYFLIALLSVYTVAFGAPAYAQFGLEDEPVAEIPAASVPAPVVATTAKTEAAPTIEGPLTLQEALETSIEFRDAALNRDKEYILSILSSTAREKADRIIANRGLDSYLLLDAPLHKWQFKCAACWQDEEHGPICAVREKIYKATKHNNEYFTRIPVMRRENGFPVIFMTPDFKGQRKIRKKMKKADQVCKLDELTITFEGTEAKNNGSKSLLLGIAAVVGQIAQ